MDRYFIKFVSKEEYADSLLSGQLYMNAAAYYWGLEIGQGDPREASISSSHQMYMNADRPIYCMYYTDNDDIAEGRLFLNKRCIKDFKCQDGWIVLIKDKEFINRILTATDFNGVHVDLGLVDYRRLSFEETKGFLSHGKTLNNLFIKSPSFSHQKEYRIATADHLEMNTHSINLDGMSVEIKDFNNPYTSITYQMNDRISDIAKKYRVEDVLSKGIPLF